MNDKTLAEKLERDRVVGWIDTAYHDVHRKIRMLANGDSSVLFGLGWSVAGTCPGPVAIMVGEGRFSGLLVVCGLVCGIALQDRLSKARSSDATVSIAPNAVGL